MKTISTLFTSLLMTASVFAADVKPKSVLTVQSSDFADIKVVLDGKRFESTGSTITIQDVDAGYHNVKVYRQKTTGLFTIFNKRYDVVYNSSLNIKAGTMMNITLDRYGRATTMESRLGRIGRGWTQDYSRDKDRAQYFDRDGHWGDFDSHAGYEQAMTDREFSDLLQQINKEWLESNKLKSATQVVRANAFTAAQVKELVLLFSFESNKLELAKQAYMNTIDKKNYYMINDVFSFNSSKDELAQYIQSLQ